jgi:hypothetical protein
MYIHTFIEVGEEIEIHTDIGDDELFCSLLIPYRLALCILRRTYRQDYETLFPCCNLK